MLLTLGAIAVFTYGYYMGKQDEKKKQLKKQLKSIASYNPYRYQTEPEIKRLPDEIPELKRIEYIPSEIPEAKRIEYNQPETVSERFVPSAPSFQYVNQKPLYG